MLELLTKGSGLANVVADTEGIGYCGSMNHCDNCGTTNMSSMHDRFWGWWWHYIVYG